MHKNGKQKGHQNAEWPILNTHTLNTTTTQQHHHTNTHQKENTRALCISLYVHV